MSLCYLGNLGIEEGDESERPERLRDKDVGNFAVLGEVVFQVLGGDVLGAAANKNLTGDQGLVSLLK
jgi:hypothetical protein